MKIKADLQDLYEKHNQAQTDPYSRRIVSYSNDWAELMELQLEQGRTVAECAENCARKADHDGITGFMYGAAVATLAKFWEHGEELRRWHNIDTQLDDEGEKANEEGTVLNPALITLGGR